MEAVLFRKGKSIRSKRLDAVSSLEGKNNASGIRYKDGRLHWPGLEIQPRIDHSDAYATEALRHTVKYCRIVRKAVRSRYHWFSVMSMSLPASI